MLETFNFKLRNKNNRSVSADIYAFSINLIDMFAGFALLILSISIR